ncbi:sulfatase/phosphatase domain-containing protein [Leisingera sp. ANG-Vp]|uniref:sulfatase/phosphatase domain-containing protein n=1 Tax=Leisingera sp. ANG-Vp TaxID=1577896 RepID=UPI0009E4AF0D|nr:sulfatase/phosphatase domain-containing protein [Leisingera sp. ANG-Vp]
MIKLFNSPLNHSLAYSAQTTAERDSNDQPGQCNPDPRRRHGAVSDQLGQFANTLILFLSDNGGCTEFMAEDGWAQFYPDVTQDGRKITMGNVPDLRPGDAQTLQSYDKLWANVSNAPFRLFKHYVHESGISTPLVAHWPKGFKVRPTAHAACHMVDILSTILEAAGAGYLTELGGHEIQPMQGESLLPLLRGKDWEREQPIFFEHEGNAAMLMGQFKLVRLHGQDWELYDMEADRTELSNIIKGEERRAQEMIRQYQDWAEKSGVMDWDIALPKLLAAWNMSSLEG